MRVQNKWELCGKLHLSLWCPFSRQWEQEVKFNTLCDMNEYVNILQFWKHGVINLLLPHHCHCATPVRGSASSSPSLPHQRRAEGTAPSWASYPEEEGREAATVCGATTAGQTGTAPSGYPGKESPQFITTSTLNCVVESCLVNSPVSLLEGVTAANASRAAASPVGMRCSGRCGVIVAFSQVMVVIALCEW